MPTGIYKRKPHSEETKKKIASGRLRRKKRLGYLNSPETRKKMSEIRKGQKATQATRKKMSQVHRKEFLSEGARKNMSESQRGEKSSLWKGGITPLRNDIRNCFKYRQWRSDIFTRDNFVCRFCGIRGGNLQADHYPKMFSKIIMEYNIKNIEEALNCEELWNINNGRTLCVKCHRKTDNFGNNRRNTK